MPIHRRANQSGTYRDDGGPTGVVCAKQAPLDFGISGKGWDVEIIAADHQNKPNVGASIAWQWFNHGGVDTIVDVPTSSTGLAVSTVCREMSKILLNSGTGTSDLAGTQCSPNTIHWTYGTFMLGKSTSGAIIKDRGEGWSFITVDYALGQALKRDTTEVITKPALASGAKVPGLANVGGDTGNGIKLGQEFRLDVVVESGGTGDLEHRRACARPQDMPEAALQ
jgi:branched-chain amino acid transport system substrate-binding protein